MRLLGIAATGVALIVGMFGISSTLFRVAMSLLYLAVAWLCIEAARIPDLPASLIGTTRP